MKKNTSMPRPSWGGLETATIATMKAMKEKERKMKEKGKVVYVGYMLQKLAENSKLNDTMLVFDVLHIDKFCM